MQQSHMKRAFREQHEAQATTSGDLLYEPLDFVMVRTPLLPIEAYLMLGTQPGLCAEDSASADPGSLGHTSLAPRDPRIRWALAVGSSALLDDLERSSPSSKDAEHLKGKLLRFLIRMSTRPTPFGLFAGVALGTWGQETDLTLAAEPPRTRTRPDMAWLLTLVQRLESRSDIRKRLRFIANPTAFVRGDRIFLTERLSIGMSRSAVSVRASGVVQRALALARTPILYQDLADRLLATTPGATEQKVEQLLTELWEQTLLLTDLRPPLTTDSPARVVVQRLGDIPEASEARAQLEAILEAAAHYDTLPPEEGIAAYRHLVRQANEVNTAAGETPVQVDMATVLRGRQVAQAVGTEVARAAELLLRMTPLPNGLTTFESYRRAFVARYGPDREIPLLELLDPQFGLGSPATYTGGTNGIAQTRVTLRSRTLLDLACSAIRDRKQVVELDEGTLKRLETWTPSPAMVPMSLDINVFVAARSKGALDAGEFQIIIGPNLGAQEAGRNLGRFADLLGPAATEALRRAAHAEEAHHSSLCAELVYLPQKLRSANVVIRPAVRSHEIALGVSPGVDTENVIPPDELVVGLNNNRFYVRWPAKQTSIVITAGHMLNNLQAPVVCRFLAEVSQARTAMVSTFDWGPVAHFPFLPRVQVGRIVLREAQWRLDTFTRTLALPADSPEVFREKLATWRTCWRVPQQVYVSFGDNRLLLDLERADQIEELRTEVRRLRDGGSLVLQEVLPGMDQVWLDGPGGHYMAELVVPLVLRPGSVQDTSAHRRQEKPGTQASAVLSPSTSWPVSSERAVSSGERLRPPGSEWLFVKLYCAESFEDDLVAYSLRTFVEEIRALELAEEWFFLRYHDPDLHLRVRFRGEPEHLTKHVLPRLCAWATGLMQEGSCSRFVFDTYDREVERYGGMGGMQLAESIFAADSRMIAELIYYLRECRVHLDRLTLGILSVDNLLMSLGLSQTTRLQWLRHHVPSRNEVGQEYRQRKTVLRELLHDPGRLLHEPGGALIAQAFATLRTALAPIAEQVQNLAAQNELSQTRDTLLSHYVHMHLNRLFGADQAAERRTLGLLLRTREGLERSSSH